MSDERKEEKPAPKLKRIANSPPVFKLEAEAEFAVSPEESAARQPLVRATETRPLTVLEAEGDVPATVPKD
jgi:hypothetical protein